ncbi:hypothetical protein EXM63_01320 [Clostridium botulinum]|uniref:Uncharacterized protein n=1 Tax=Clostridium botulinum TaxID=1491 RepID=A0A6M0SVZ1_CLOBO|nr:hypothetical protein [Clostridium botulinum]NFI73069.1 hypothetical protein [Clostridium sporogenes]NFL71281.1 hypothetical protein [Clostridium sporogenes]NFM23109.1 hypothetical protein [Clostridium sporogenes]NFP60481.1 hypothetical protein [Clostridium sporogenes]
MNYNKLSKNFYYKKYIDFPPKGKEYNQCIIMNRKCMKTYTE